MSSNSASCHPRRAIILLLTLLLCPCAASATDSGASQRTDDATSWARFRGPNGSGLSDANIPARWTDHDYNWNTKLPGGGNSSPVIWGDRIFITCAKDDTGEHMVVCVNAGDGSIRWTRTYPSQTYRHHPFNSYASSSPAADEKHVYVCWSTPEQFTLLALDHDGKDVWSKDLGPFVSEHGGGQSPIVFQNRVIVSDDQEGPESFLFALDRDTGNLVWKVSRGKSDKFSASTPCVFRPKNGPPQLIFSSRSHGFTAVDPGDGHTVWELPNLFDARTVSSPFTAGGLIFGTCGEGTAGHVLVAARPGEEGHPAGVVYEIRRSTPYVPTPIVRNGLLFYFSDNGMLTCAEAATGRQVWKARLGGNFFGSPVCAGDKIFCISKEGEVFVVGAAEKFQLLGRNPLKLEDDSARQPPLSTTPAIANGRMYIRSYTHLVSIGGKAAR